jgi:hypothetical protein
MRPSGATCGNHRPHPIATIAMMMIAVTTVIAVATVEDQTKCPASYGNYEWAACPKEKSSHHHKG